MEKNFSEMMSQEICVFVSHGLELSVPPMEIMNDAKIPISRRILDSISRVMDVYEMLMDIIVSRGELMM